MGLIYLINRYPPSTTQAQDISFCRVSRRRSFTAYKSYMYGGC